MIKRWLLLSIGLVLVSPALAANRPHTYLLSVVNLPIGPNEALSSFSIDTWNVTFKAVCRFPPGWRVTAGRDATPDGELSGAGSHWVAFLPVTDVDQLRNIALVRLNGSVRRRRLVDGQGVATAASFGGTAKLVTYRTERSRRVRLTWANVRLRPALSCR